MDKITESLINLQKRLEKSPTLIDNGILADIANKIKLYLNKYFKNNSNQYLDLLSHVNLKPDYNSHREESISALKSIITTMLEDIELSKSDFSIVSEEEKNIILNKLRQQSEDERNKLEIEVAQIRRLNEEMRVKQEELSRQEKELFDERKKQEIVIHNAEKKIAEERLKFLEQEKKANEERKIQQQLLIEQEEKFNSFKAKLEIADKNFDFQSNALTNKKTAITWAIIAFIFTIVLIILLCINITDSSSLIAVTNAIKGGIKIDNTNKSDIVTYAIYIGYIKYLVSRFLIYSMIIYAVIFSVKNYNAQMHNHIVNTHKSNAFKSTLSLLNTARSDDGNDKLLIQATQAIFSHQQSGYSGKDSEPNNPNLITNVVETISKKI